MPGGAVSGVPTRTTERTDRLPSPSSGGRQLSLDVLVPTLNRAPLLEWALRSLLTTPAPKGLDVRVWAIDNGSTDDTAELVDRLSREFPGRLGLIHERRRGKSRALNAGIASTRGDLVGMIDDDERIGAAWYAEVFRAFQDDTLDFAGGPYHPDWGTTEPRWVPPEYLAVLGVSDGGPAEADYSTDFPGILKGGNAVIRRRVLERVGPYDEHLGPSTYGRLLSCEDEDMYHRLLKHGARGRYLPAMAVHHAVLPDRLRPGYFRRWCFSRGVSRGLLDRKHPLAVAYLAGIPRFVYGRAARGLARLTSAHLGGRASERTLADELPLWDLAGFMWGKHVYPLFRYSPLRSRRAPLQPARKVDTSPGSDPDQVERERWTALNS